MAPVDPSIQRDMVRQRPAMYVGDVYDGSGLLHMVWEVVGNSLDEHVAGHCSRIDVRIEAEGAVTVADNGRGIPVRDFRGEPFAQAALTRMHDSATMDGHAPHDHLGRRGSGLFAVNALSERLELHVHRDGEYFTQRYARGISTSAFERVGSTTEHGTTITFLPDPEIFPDVLINPGPIAIKLRELACLNPGLELTFTDSRHLDFHEPTGLRGFLARLRGRSVLPIGEPFNVSTIEGAVRVEVAAEWVSAARSCSVESFANSHRTTSDGTHVDGLFAGLVAALRTRHPEVCRGRREAALQRAVAEGLHAVVCVRLHDPTFAKPTRDRLSTPEAKSAVAAAVHTAFVEALANDAVLESHLRKKLAET